MKKILLLLLLSVGISTVIFFVNNVIETTWDSAAGEILVFSIPIFIIIALFYYVNRTLLRKIKGAGKKKPSGEGRL